jgi:putative transcriptional regulator
VADRSKLDATSEEDIRSHMIEDGQDPDECVPDSYELVVPPQVVREKLKMTQEEFAQALRVPIGTLRNWEQRRVGLDPAVRSLLAIIYRMPEALKALTPKRAA